MKIIQDGWIFQPHLDGSRLRVLLLTSDDPQHAYLRRLLSHHLNLVATIEEPGTAQKQRLRRNHRYLDLAYRVYQAWRQKATGRTRWRRQYFADLAQDLPPATSPLHRVDSVNNAHTRQLVAEMAPDLTVVCGTGILGRRLLKQTPGIMINIHGGWLPEYKGNHGVYFAYRNQDWDRIGATLHLVTPALDAGPVIERVTPDTLPGDSDEQLYTRSVHHAALRLTDLALGLERGLPLSVQPQEDRGTTYRHRDRRPLPELSLWLRRMTGRHRPPVAPNEPAHDRTPVEIADLGYLLNWDDIARLATRFAAGRHLSAPLHGSKHGAAGQTLWQLRNEQADQ